MTAVCVLIAIVALCASGLAYEASRPESPWDEWHEHQAALRRVWRDDVR